MSSNTENALCRTSDIARVDIVKAVEDVIQDNKTLKEEVIEALKLLSARAEGLVIELVKDDMWSTGAKIVGRGIIIVSGVVSIFLLSAGGVGAGIGIGGIVVGYAVVAGSKAYEMKCSREHANKLKEISDKVEAEVNRYEESQRKVFVVLGHLGAFDAKQKFAVNLEAIRDIVQRAEKEADIFFPNIDGVISKLKACYTSLSEDQKGRLNAEDFLLTMSSLTKGASMPSGPGLGEVGTAVGSVIGDAVGAAPWFEFVHSLNIIINTGFIFTDIKKFWELNKMRKAWNEGGDAKIDMLEKEKFEKEMSMKDLIDKIRDQILEKGY